jgi:hypothetical protein
MGVLCLALGGSRLRAQDSFGSLRFEEVFRSHGGRIEDLRLSSDGRTGLIRYEEQIVVADFLTGRELYTIPYGAAGLQGGDVLAMDMAPRAAVCFFVVRKSDEETVIVRLKDADKGTRVQVQVTPWESEDTIYEICVNERVVDETPRFDLLVASKRGLQVVDSEGGHVNREWASGIPCLALARSGDGTRIALSYGSRVDIVSSQDFHPEGTFSLHSPVHHLAFFNPDSSRLLCGGDEAAVVSLGPPLRTTYLGPTTIQACAVVPSSSGVLLSKGKALFFVKDALQAPGNAERYTRTGKGGLVRLEYLAGARALIFLEKGGDCLQRATFVPYGTSEQPPSPEVLSPRPGSTFGDRRQELRVRLLGASSRTAASLRVRVDGNGVSWEPGDAASQGPLFKGGGEYRLRVTLPPQSCTVTVEAVNPGATSPCAVPVPMTYQELRPEVELVQPGLEDGPMGIPKLVTDQPRPVLGLRIQGTGSGDVLEAKVKFNTQPGLKLRPLNAPPRGFARPGDEDVRWYELIGWDHTDGRLSVQVTNGRNLSKERALELSWASTRVNSKVFALCIGADLYSDKHVTTALPNSRKGAQAVQEMLRQEAGKTGVPLAFDRLLTGKEATQANILKALDDLQDQVRQERAATGNPNIVTVVYWSGHGDSNARMGGRFELLPYDGEFSARMGRNITGADLRDALLNIPGTSVLILETCHSGDMARLGADRIKALSAGEKPLYVLASSAADQSTQAADDQPLGYFTEALLAGIYGGIHPADPKGWLSFSEIAGYVRLKVAGSDVGHEQTVVAGEEAFWSTDGKHELPMFVPLDSNFRKILNHP